MKRASRYLCCVLLAVAYVFAYMGFGVHTCHEDGSRHLVWLVGDVSCEAIHHHSHDTGDDHHHNDGCCSTHVYVLTDAQDSDSGVERGFDLPAEGLPVMIETPCFVDLMPSHLIAQISHAPPLTELSSLSLLSFWLI